MALCEVLYLLEIVVHCDSSIFRLRVQNRITSDGWRGAA